MIGLANGVGKTKDAKPVFFGHYWLEDAFPIIQAENVVCLDYSIAVGGHLVAYRWNGERALENSHFVQMAYSSSLSLDTIRLA